MTPTQKLTIERAELQNKLNSDRYVEIRSNATDAKERMDESKPKSTEGMTMQQRNGR